MEKQLLPSRTYNPKPVTRYLTDLHQPPHSPCSSETLNLVRGSNCLRPTDPPNEPQATASHLLSRISTNLHNPLYHITLTLAESLKLFAPTTRQDHGPLGLLMSPTRKHYPHFCSSCFNRPVRQKKISGTRSIQVEEYEKRVTTFVQPNKEITR